MSMSNVNITIIPFTSTLGLRWVDIIVIVTDVVIDSHHVAAA